MSSNNIKRVDKEAVEIRRIVSEKRVEIDTSVLNEAVQTSEKLISHAEKVRRDIESNRNRPAALKNLYRVGVGISDENYVLRKKIMGIQHNMDELSRRNPALRPLAHQIRCLEQSVYQNELELNNRNRILRTYIRDNFSQRERNWALAIERRKAGDHMANNNKYQLGIHNNYPLSVSAPFPQRIVLSQVEEVVEVRKSDGSCLSRRRTTKSITLDPAPADLSNYKRLPKK